MACSHERLNCWVAVILSILCTFTSFFMLPGLKSLAADVGALQDTVAPLMAEGANLTAMLEAKLVPKVNLALVPVNSSLLALGQVQVELETAIKATRDNIFLQGQKYAAAENNATLQKQIIAVATQLYDGLDAEAEHVEVQLEPLKGLQDLLAEVGAMSLVKKVEGLLRTVEHVYGAVQGVYHFISKTATMFGSSVPAVNFPNLHLDDVRRQLKKVQADLQDFLTDAKQLSTDITGEIPGGPFEEGAVRLRIEEIARNFHANDTVHSADLRSSVALSAFRRHDREVGNILSRGQHILGNASFALSLLNNISITGATTLDALATRLAQSHNYPAKFTAMVNVQTILTTILCAWIIFYTFGRQLLPKNCASCLYFMFHIVLYLYGVYCLILFGATLLATAVYELIGGGPCHGNFIQEAKYTDFCRNHIFPTGAVLKPALVASFFMVVLAWNLLIPYHGLLAEILPSQKGKSGSRLMGSDSDEDE